VSVPGALTALLGALDDAGVAWTLLRPRASLAEPAGDVDVLVAPADVARVRALGEAEGFLAVPVPGPDLHLAGHDAAAGRFVWVHVQDALRIAGGVVPAAAVLAGAARDGEGAAPEPAGDVLLWILLLRALVDKGTLPERHRETVRRLASAWGGGPPELLALARRHGITPDAAVAAAAAGDRAGLLALSVHRPVPPRRLPARLAALAADLRRGREAWGITVAVLGPDGAGKTTLAEGLAASLPLPTRIQYMGLTGGNLPRADRLRVPGLVFAARVAILWSRWLRGAFFRARGRIVLFDRYALDGAVPSGMRLSPVGRISRRAQRWAVPAPDLAVVLDASGATMHARKGEYDPAVLERWRAAYTRLRARGGGLVVLDAEQPADRVRAQAEAAVWRRYAELRHGRAA
jgi:thymidylate kinase